MSITNYSLMVIHGSDDIHVSSFGKDNAVGYLISYGERYQPLLSSNPIYRNAEEAISCGEVMLQALREYEWPDKSGFRTEIF